MPQNAFHKPRENCTRLYEKSKKKIECIANNTIYYKEDRFSSNSLFDILQIPLQMIIRSMTRKHLIKLSFGTLNLLTEELICLADKSFRTDANCTGCGICYQVCPVDNITIIDKKPEWLHHCENCRACFNSCPQKAIQGGLVSNNFYYRHPETKASEILSLKA
jgi:ferredoxin